MYLANVSSSISPRLVSQSNGNFRDRKGLVRSEIKQKVQFLHAVLSIILVIPKRLQQEQSVLVYGISTACQRRVETFARGKSIQ